MSLISIYFLFALQIFKLLEVSSANEESLTTSIFNMVQLLDMEMKLIESVKNYAHELQKKVDALTNLVQHLKEENHKSVNNREDYLHNPLNSFTLVRRMYNDWPLIELFMTQPVEKDAILKYRLEIASATDLEEASSALYRLQMVYDLNPDDLVQGLINGKQYDANLKSIDCYFMGYYLFSKKLYYPASLWLNLSIINFEEMQDFNKIISFGKEKPLKLYAEALIAENRPKLALTYLTQASDLKPSNAYLLSRKHQIQQLINTDISPPLQKKVQNPKPLIISNYEFGCRGHFSNKTSKLFCLYNTTTTPFLKLAPIKMEILQLQPFIVLFHDVISDQEIEHLKRLARPNLMRAETYDPEVAGPVIDEDRASEFSFFEDDTDEITERLNRRIIDMTGLAVYGSESLQVANYVMGGYFDLHHDYFNLTDDNELLRESGDRFSTVLFYLSDVEQGGATVFPEQELAVFPRKGSALVWYNLNNKMEPDDSTLHAACPVLVGIKWVCNKWIRVNDQTFKRPCYI